MKTSLAEKVALMYREAVCSIIAAESHYRGKLYDSAGVVLFRRGAEASHGEAFHGNRGGVHKNIVAVLSNRGVPVRDRVAMRADIVYNNNYERR